MMNFSILYLYTSMVWTSKLPPKKDIHMCINVSQESEDVNDQILSISMSCHPDTLPEINS